MSSCSEAFVTLRPCAIIVVGVTGSMPVHGIGTTMFRVSLGASAVILTVFNCLLCHGEDGGFNLLGVSQILRTKTNSITFCGKLWDSDKERWLGPSNTFKRN